MLDVARKWSHVAVVVELAQADGALVVLKGRVVVVELSLNNAANDCVPYLFVQLCVLCSSYQRQAQARKTADQQCAYECCYKGRLYDNEENDDGVDEIQVYPIPAVTIPNIYLNVVKQVCFCYHHVYASNQKRD